MEEEGEEKKEFSDEEKSNILHSQRSWELHDGIFSIFGISARSVIWKSELFCLIPSSSPRHRVPKKSRESRSSSVWFRRPGPGNRVAKQ